MTDLLEPDDEGMDLSDLRDCDGCPEQDLDWLLMHSMDGEYYFCSPECMMDFYAENPDLADDF